MPKEFFKQDPDSKFVIVGRELAIFLAKHYPEHYG